jgi:pimeloyl-ACP methyl ester carboxylesterase
MMAAASALALALALLAACTSHSSSGPNGGLSGTAAPNGSAAASDTTPSDGAAAGSGSAAASGATETDGRANPGAFASTLKWTDITKQVDAAFAPIKRKLTFARATMTVPLNWADTGGKKVGITVVRIRSAKQHDRIGSLIINPGGPGDSAVEFALGVALDELPQGILDRFDVIGFDPRGVSASHPLNCITNKEKDAESTSPADPTTEAAWQQDTTEVTRRAQECYAAYGSDLTFYSTTETVRDMEALRAKLGDSKLSYLGFSYGTLIGAEYASAYPDKVRALVLDGAVDPTIDTIEQDKAQAAGFQLAFSHFASACTATGSACKLGADPQGFVLRLMAKAAANPIPSTNPQEKRRAGDGAVLLGVASALYDHALWPTLTKALVNADRGDAMGILALDDQYNQRSPDGTYTNIEDANAAIGCADTAQRPTAAQARALEPQWRAENPLFGGSAASGLGFCALWKAPPDEQIAVADNHSAPVLVIGTTGDPATPISGARHLATLLGSGRLLVWNGDGHTAYPKTPCITGYVNSYFTDLTVPPVGATCPAA